MSLISVLGGSGFLAVIFFLLILCLQSVSGRHFNVKENFHPNIVSRSPDLFRELDQYIAWHNNDTTLTDPNFCNRTFVLATYACPQAIGNHMHEFLNNFAGGFITNRTILWHFCNRKACQLDNEGDCDEFLTRMPWILSLQDAQRRWNELQCPGSFNSFQIVNFKFRYQAEEILVCCGLDAMKNFVILDFGTLELHELFSLSLNYSVRLTRWSHNKAQQLYEFGEDFGYGVLFRSSFQIKHFIKQRNDESMTALIKQQKIEGLTENDMFIIGIHIRHSDPNNHVETVDTLEYECIGNALKKHFDNSTHKKCVILLASDRPHEFEKWEGDTRFPGCTTITSNHSRSHVAWSEHGPFTGQIAISDIELLSRSDIFIGSSYGNAQLRNIVSTFSMLIAELRATNGKSKISGGVKSLWLPFCHETIGARHHHKDLMTNPSFACGNSATRKEGQLMVPIQCPYWNKTDEDYGNNDLWYLEKK